jgi:CheY-like chemotaxis protein
VEQEGWTLDVVTEGDRCLARFEKGAPDVCLVDADLPDIPGLDLVPRIHAIDANVPSSSSTPADHRGVRRGHPLGAANYLSKPIDSKRPLDAVQGPCSSCGRSGNRAAEGGDRHASPRSASTKSWRTSPSAAVRTSTSRPGRAPMYRIGRRPDGQPLPRPRRGGLSGLLLQFLGPDGYKALDRDHEFDTAYLLPEIARCRVNAYKRLGQYAAAFPHDPADHPDHRDDGLPPVLKDICKTPQGWSSVTGPTAAGSRPRSRPMMDHIERKRVAPHHHDRGPR